MSSSPVCFVIVGPTAVGKTSIAITLATHFQTEIISADSRQCFKELDIGVAKPSASQLELVKHHFINSHSIHEEVNAAVFEKYALAAADNIFQKSPVAIMVGGTGLYIKAFTEGMDDIPDIPSSLRDEIIAAYREKGLGWLQDEIKIKDPRYFGDGEINNPQRLMRALEVKLATGESIRNFQAKKKKTRPYDLVKIGLALPREKLNNQINLRVDQMVAAGLKAEAQSLLPFAHINALQTVGYKEWFEYFLGLHDEQKTIEHIKKNTRLYAKRQMTWFTRDKTVHWFAPVDETRIIEFVENYRSSTKSLS